MIEEKITQPNGQKIIKIRTRSIVVVLMLFVLSIGSASFVFARANQIGFGTQNQPPSTNMIPNAVNTLKSVVLAQSPVATVLTSEEQQVINVVRNSSPAVVSIIASEQVQKRENGESTTALQRVGAGSGFFVSSDGHIVTNKHVVDSPDAQFTVILNDSAHLGQRVKATVVAKDPNNDIAILKIDNMDNLPFLNFANSDNISVGQTAIAIGFALGQFNNSVSKGVVSGLMRNVTAEGSRPSEVEDLRGVIQTDAAINPGVSGGPLLDTSGNVIGINVATANAPGIGFAIPGNLVKTDFQQVISGGKLSDIKVPFIGVRYQAVTPELQSNMDLPYSYGMLVVKGDNNEPAVVSGSAADKIGIKEGDIILEADGKQLNEINTLSDVIAKNKAGDSIPLKIFRNGQIINATITLGTQ